MTGGCAMPSKGSFAQQYWGLGMSNGDGNANASRMETSSGASIGTSTGASRTILAIDELRRRLLDLSLNNQLLNFHPSEKSRRHIRIVDEVPSVLIEKLQAGKNLIFTPVEMPEI